MAKQNRLPSVDDQYLPPAEATTAAVVATEEPTHRREPQPPRERSDLAAAIAEEAEAQLLAADEILREIVTQERQPSFEERLFFTRLNWTGEQINSQCRRMAQVVKFERIAGTAADREASEAEAATASQLLATEGPKIAEQIAKLQETLQQLERDKHRSLKRVAEQAAAVENLKKLAPPHVTEKANHLRRAYRETTRKELQRVELRLHQLVTTLDERNYQYKYDWFDALGRCFPGHSMNRAFRNHSQAGPQNWFADWDEIQREVKREQAELQQQRAQLQAECAAAEAEIDALLNYYAR